MKSILLFLLILSSFSSFAKKNLVCNGSFEKTQLNSRWDVFDESEVPCWRIRGNKTGLEIQKSGVVEIATHGNQYAELDSHPKNGFTRSKVSLYQEINTVPGKTYKLSFDYSMRKNRKTSKMKVLIDKKPVMVVMRDERGFNRYSVKFKAKSQKHTIEFRSMGEKDTLGALIDRVRVIKVNK